MTDAMADTADPSAQKAYDQRWRESYWLAQPAYSDDFATEVCERWQGHFEWCDKAGLIARWAKSYRAYHGMRSQQGRESASLGIRFTGQQGELADLEANQYRTLLKHVLTLGTSGRPSFDARATNNDSQSSQQVKLTRDVIEYYLRDKGTERKLKLVAESSLPFGVSFLHQYWDQHEGPPSQFGGRAGDVQHVVLTPLDVAHERGRDLADAGWWIVRDWQNKYDLAATYPDLADDILKVEDGQDYATLTRWRVGQLERDTKDDLVPVFWFYARRSSALPEGRHAILVGDVVVYDGPLPYEDCPVYPMQPGTFLGSDLGYADGWDILGLHELHSGLLSALTTRATAFSVPTIVTGEAGATVQDLQGMRLIRASAKGGQEPVIPQLLDLFSVPGEFFQAMEFASGMMHSALGVNAVISGTSQEGVKSGAHGALLQAMAIQFNSGFQQSWAFLLESFASGLVRLLKRFVQEERLIALAGTTGKSSVSAFRGEDLDGIDRVTIDLGNPMSRTAAGRHEIAQALLQSVVQPGSMVQTPEQYLSVLTTGRLDPLLAGPTSEIEATKAENEVLYKGEYVAVHILERHDLHVQEHRVLLNDPEAKKNPALVQAVTNHVAEHISEWMRLSVEQPELLFATKTPPLPVPMMGMPGMGGPLGGPLPTGEAPPEGEPQPPPGPSAAGPTPPTAAGDVTGLPRQPDLPTNPATGEQAAAPATS